MNTLHFLNLITLLITFIFNLLTLQNQHGIRITKELGWYHTFSQIYTHIIICFIYIIFFSQYHEENR